MGDGGGFVRNNERNNVKHYNLMFQVILQMSLAKAKIWFKLVKNIKYLPKLRVCRINAQTQVNENLEEKNDSFKSVM